MGTNASARLRSTSREPQTDHSRRAVTVLLVALGLVAVPVVANATFSDREAPGLSVGTRTMATPTAIAGTFSCKATGANETVAITVTGFTDAGPSGSTYTYRLLLGSTVADTKTSTSSATSVALNGSGVSDGKSTTWTVSIQAKLGGWTGGAGTATAVCKANGKDTGTL